MNRFRRACLIIGLLAAVSCLSVAGAADKEPARPNVLFLICDDLNCDLGSYGHPQVNSPNIDRLAAQGQLFANAHCTASVCNPSRVATMIGRRPSSTGIYDNSSRWHEALPKSTSIPQHFKANGYHVLGGGKVYHHMPGFNRLSDWHSYFHQQFDGHYQARLHRGLDVKNFRYPEGFPLNRLPSVKALSRPPRNAKEFDWGALQKTDNETGDGKLITWAEKFLTEPPSQRPFFLAVGIFRPHLPFYAPQKYFDAISPDELTLPTVKQGDVDDLPESGKAMASSRRGDYELVMQTGKYRELLQAYLASIQFADAMIGRLLDALEQSGQAEITIVVLWSDHGWHLGEKQHWQKYTAWRACTRVPLMIRAPKGTPGLPGGTIAGTRCDAPANLLSLYPTLTELTGLPRKVSNDAPSLVPLLKNAKGDWPHVSITYLGRPGNYGLSGSQFRYIAYDNGDEELYDIKNDPHEWTNLATKPESAAQIARLRSHVPTKFAKYENASVASLPELKWNPINAEPAPASKPDGNKFNVVISNKSGQPATVFWMNRQGEPRPYGTLETAWSKPYQTRPGAIWMIGDAKGHPRGYFRVGDRQAHAVIPPDPK